MDSDCEPLNVTFFPPLHHQRRIWILDILRRERLTEIIDIGCGEGSLLATLCQPAPWLRAGCFQDDDHELSSLFRGVGLNDVDTPDLHPTRIAGLDISGSQLEIATECTSPASINPLYTRWEPLDVELWQGSVDAINPAFVDAECIVASELIEHVTDDILVHVAPVVLGVYRPRLFLITTPSYTFNGRWSPPGSRDPQGYPDPTGRTDRTFRHPDHKFEWTVEEFIQWCKSVAHQWGYMVETGTIGLPREKDPWGRDGILGGASQVASFRRLDNHLSQEAREQRTQAIRSIMKNPHTLVATHHHEAHSRAGHPSDLSEIEEAMLLRFLQWGETILRVEELWFADDLPILCGGSMDVMINATERSPELQLQRIAGQRRGNWKVRVVGGLTARFPEQTMETESVTREDDEPYCDAEEGSVDPGVYMGPIYEDNPSCAEDIGWTQDGGGVNHWARSWGGS